jgi:chemotaxis protein MotB
MSRMRRAGREQAPHTDDWLITYADMITLLLCFFVVFYVILSARKNATQEEGGSATHVTQMFAKDSPHASAPHTAQRDPISDDFGKFGLPQVAPVPIVAIKNPGGLQAVEKKPDAAPAVDGIKGDRITAFELGGSELFDSGSGTLKEDGKSVLQGIADQIQSDRYDGYNIVVEGHTDDAPIATPRFSSNWELSMARAAAVVHFLLDRGIAPGRLRAAGYGDTQPKVPNRDADGATIPENQAQNRRVVIRLEKIETPE